MAQGVLLDSFVKVSRRVLAFLALLLLTSAACSSSQEEETGGASAAVTSGACSASRDEILSGTSALRAQAIERGFGWLDANVPYSQSKSHAGYRTDCSGFVSMCWELGTSTTTSALVSTSTHASKLSSWDQLLPGAKATRPPPRRAGRARATRRSRRPQPAAASRHRPRARAPSTCSASRSCPARSSGASART